MTFAVPRPGGAITVEPRSKTLAACWLSLVTVVACDPGPATSAEPATLTQADAAPAGSALPTALAGTRWRLVEIRSMDDAQGTTRPDDPTLYRMNLNANGTVTMRLNCNRGKGSWSASADASGSAGSFSLGPLAVTRAACAPPSLDERIARDMSLVRSYLQKDGRLYLSLTADGGVYAWEPDASAE